MKFRGVVDTQIERKIAEVHTAACLKLAAAEMLPEGLVALTVHLSSTMRTTAGRAYTKTIRIDLHYRLLQDKPKDLEETYLHELAHIVAVLKYGRPGFGHGALWKKVMQVLGCNDERCHKMDVSAFKRKQVRYLYRCTSTACSRHTRLFELSSRKHTKSVRIEAAYGKAAYRCTCGKEIEYTLNTTKG